MNIESNIWELEGKIEFRFKDRDLIKHALTHSSFTNEQKINKWENYQRLEYLGDAVLELVISEYLYQNNPDMAEGQMSKIRASIVCEPTLATCAREMDLGKHILLGKGEEAGGGRERDSILSDIFESIIGAIYLDGGFAKAREHIERFVLKNLDERHLFMDSKSVIQEMVQAQKGIEMHYELLSESGPEHMKVFEVGIFIDGECIATAKEHNKKRAEQKAAYLAIRKLKGLADGQ